MRWSGGLALTQLRERAKEPQLALGNSKQQSTGLSGRAILAPALVAEIVEAVRPLTMVHESGVEFVITESVRLVDEGVPGVFVECGVWRGGCAIASLLAQRAAFGQIVRPIYLLDSFEG